MKHTSFLLNKIALLLFSVAILLAGGTGAMHGQSALDGFDPNANGAINVVVVQADGKILIGGEFTTLSANGGAAVARTNIARLNADGSLDTNFNPNASAAVSAIAVQADGKILAGGFFSGTNSIGGESRNRIARLDPTTGLADAFGPNADAPVNTVTVLADGKVLVGGSFSGIGGQTNRIFARLNNDIVALQNLAVTQSGITWTRGGSSPHLTRVTFESSTNNLIYTTLGDGTATGSNWTLTGLNLATRQNLYIRARGFYRSGLVNGSENTTETVRNVFLTPIPLLNIQRNANTNVVLSWPTNFPDFKLEASTNLNTNVWSVVTNAPVTNGMNIVVTNTIGGSARFYRLRQ